MLTALCPAKVRINVEEGFYELVREVRKWNAMIAEDAHDSKRPKKKSFRLFKKDRIKDCVLI